MHRDEYSSERKYLTLIRDESIAQVSIQNKFRKEEQNSHSHLANAELFE